MAPPKSRNQSSIINNHVWVSEDYREYVRKTLNISKSWQWKLLEYLLFYPHIDRLPDDDEDYWDDPDRHQVKDNDRVVISTVYIQALTGICNRPIKDIMDEFFQDTGIPFDVNPHLSFISKARSVVVHWTPEMLEKTEKELATLWRHKKHIVLFDSGQAYSERKHAEYKRAYLKNIQALTLKNPEHPAAELVNYLHSPRVLYALSAQVAKTEDLVVEAIRKITREPVRRYALRTYNMVQQCAYIGYKDVKRTARIYATSQTILHLPRDIRKTVFTGTWSLDLRASQLAIVADLWGMKAIRGFLDTRKSIWTELLDYLSLEQSYKPLVKGFLYRSVYGMGSENLEKQAIDWFGSTRILSHPLIKELLAYRGKELKKIVARGGASDVWGHFHSIGNYERTGDKTQSAKKVLARVVQSYEIEIMLAGFKVIEKNKRNLLMLAWLHDGIYVIPTDNHHLISNYLERVNQAVQKRALLMGIRTELEIELID